MRRKIREDPITQKHPKTFQGVPSAAHKNSPTECAHPAVITKAERLSAVQHKPYTIGVDIMGSDNSPSVLLKAVESLIPEATEQNIKIVVIGTSDTSPPRPLLFQQCSSFVEMHENPASAIKTKKDASLFVGLKLLKEKKIDAFVSAGNTGALVLGSKIILSMLAPILRPALQVHLPTKKELITVLDVGANVQYKATHLIQFAFMGTAYWHTQGVLNPTIGLLNIGSESIKGTSELKTAYHILQQIQEKKKPPFSFTGNVEGKSVFDGDVNTLVTDGFTGNIFLKTAEGIANLVLDQIEEKFQTTEEKKLAFKDLKKYLHYAEYPGALLLGVKGLVVKCHGYSTPLAFANAVRGSIHLVQTKFLKSFQSHLKKIQIPTQKTIEKTLS